MTGKNCGNRPYAELPFAWYKCMVKIVLLTLIFLAGCEREVIVPYHLTGEWITSAPGYADRHLKFTKDTLTYGIGNGKEASHKIDKIDAEKIGHTTIYSFYYRDADNYVASLSFTYKPDDGGSIQLKHDNKTWKRAAP